jgi:hypothetical protein
MLPNHRVQVTLNLQADGRSNLDDCHRQTKAPIHRYRFPPQETELRGDEDLRQLGGQKFGRVMAWFGVGSGSRRAKPERAQQFEQADRGIDPRYNRLTCRSTLIKRRMFNRMGED